MRNNKYFNQDSTHSKVTKRRTVHAKWTAFIIYRAQRTNVKKWYLTILNSHLTGEEGVRTLIKRLKHSVLHDDTEFVLLREECMLPLYYSIHNIKIMVIIQWSVF